MTLRRRMNSSHFSRFLDDNSNSHNNNSNNENNNNSNSNNNSNNNKENNNTTTSSTTSTPTPAPVIHPSPSLVSGPSPSPSPSPVSDPRAHFPWHGTRVSVRLRQALVDYPCTTLPLPTRSILTIGLLTAATTLTAAPPHPINVALPHPHPLDAAAHLHPINAAHPHHVNTTNLNASTAVTLSSSSLPTYVMKVHTNPT